MASPTQNDEPNQNGSSSSLPTTTYGWIGIGNMGYGMAMNLAIKIPSSAHLLILDLNKPQVEKFLSEAVDKHGLSPSKITVASSGAEIARKASIILTSLPHGEAVLKVYTDPETGIVAGLSSLEQHENGDEATSNGAINGDHTEGKLLLDTSTIEVTASSTVSTAITSLGFAHEFLDAPVSGGIPIAALGTLTTMVGASSQSVFERAKPIIETFSDPKNVFYCGKPTAGLATKLINNYVAMTAFVGLCEGMHTGALFGLDPQTLGRIINVSSGMSWNSLNMNPVKGVVEGSSANRDFQGGFPTELARGVVGKARGLMKSVGANTVLAGKVEGVWERGVGDERCAGMEGRSVWRLWEGDGSGLGELKEKHEEEGVEVGRTRSGKRRRVA